MRMKSIEERLCGRLAEELAGLLPDVKVTGSWLVADEGEVQGRELAECALVEVSASPHYYADNADRAAVFPLSVTCSFTFGGDATKAGFAEAFRAVSDYCDLLHLDADRARRLFRMDDFDVLDATVTGGSDDTDRQGRCWTFALELSVRGHVIHREAR